MIGRRCEGAVDLAQRILDPPEAREGSGSSEPGTQCILPPVEPMLVGEGLLAIELPDRLRHVVLGKTHEAEQPVEPERGITASAFDEAILNGRAMPEDRLGVRQVAARGACASA